MPWTCQRCAEDVADAAPCPGCGAHKTSWTVVAERTRVFVFSGRRFALYVGDGGEPRPRAEADAQVTLSAAVRAPVLSKDVARGLTSEGLLPATQDVLFVALTAGRGRDRAVTLEPLFDTAPSVEHVVPGPADAGGATTYHPFVFVFGEGGLDGIDFGGVPVVDLSEANEAGHAPEVEVSALGLPAQALKTAAGEWIELELVDDAGRPASGASYTLRLPDGTTRSGTADADGLALEAALPAGTADLELPGSAGWTLDSGEVDAATSSAGTGPVAASTAQRSMALLEFNTWRNTIGDAWVADCEGTLGMSTLSWVDPRVRAGVPGSHAAKAPLTLEAITAFVATRPHWLMIAGHHYVRTTHSLLRGAGAYPQLRIYDDRLEVQMTGDAPARTFAKGGAELGLDAQLEVLMLGGCDVFTSSIALRRLQAFFGGDGRKPLILGCLNRTGTDTVRAVLGQTKKDKSDRDVEDYDWLPWEQGFFGRLAGRVDDPVAIRDAWLGAARKGWGETKYVDRETPYYGTFHAYDADGKDWQLVPRDDGTVEIVAM